MQSYRVNWCCKTLFRRHAQYSQLETRTLTSNANWQALPLLMHSQFYHNNY